METACPGGPFVALPDCGGDVPLAPLWVHRRLTAADPFGPYEYVTAASCPADLVELTLDDFRRLPLPAPVLKIQGNRTNVLIGKPTVTMTDPTPVTLTTTVLGYPVTVQATPTVFHWDYGDGATIDTRDPGRPWPHQSVWHAYRHPAQVTVTLTTEWTARYQVAGVGPWRDVTGTATTTATTPLDVRELSTYLTCDTRNPDCDPDKDDDRS